MDVQDIAALAARGAADDAGAAGLERALIEAAGPGNVTTALERRTFFGTDIAARGAAPAAVVQAPDAETLVRVLRECSARGAAVVPRGGGFSYTGGYTPDAEGAVVIDLRRMNRIVEINARDMYVTVESGCTWERLYEALKARGLRTPYFGPISGYSATVGGALSQGSFFLGSTQHGQAAESVLGLEVALADGTILTTGSGGSNEGAPPFLRQYGPDLTGLFLNDCGAMGFKTKATLRLLPFPAHQAYASFAFADHAGGVAAVSAIGRSGLAAECYCWDPFFVRLMAAASTSRSEDLRFLLNVVKGGSGLVDGLGAAARIAVAGRRALRGDRWLVHATIDDASKAGAAARLALLRRLAVAEGGSETTPTAPRGLRGTPFTDFNTAERRTERRNLPIHGIAPHSRAGAVADEVYGCLDEHAGQMRRHDVTCGVILFAVGAQAVCVEPLLSWRDEEHFLHDRVRETSDMEGLARHARRPEATAAALELRDALKAVFRRHGCAHAQVGRSYPWAQTRQAAAMAVLTAAKDAVDPRRLMNPGVLGFAGPAG